MIYHYKVAPPTTGLACILMHTLLHLNHRYQQKCWTSCFTRTSNDFKEDRVKVIRVLAMQHFWHHSIWIYLQKYIYWLHTDGCLALADVRSQFHKEFYLFSGFLCKRALNLFISLKIPNQNKHQKYQNLSEKSVESSKSKWGVSIDANAFLKG